MSNQKTSEVSVPGLPGALGGSATNCDGIGIAEREVLAALCETWAPTSDREAWGYGCGLDPLTAEQRDVIDAMTDAVPRLLSALTDAEREVEVYREGWKVAARGAQEERARAKKAEQERDRALALYAMERGALEALDGSDAILLQQRNEARAQKDGAYRERDQVVALAARMAAVLHWPTWLGRHEDKPGDPPWDEDWRNIIFIALPSGQVSWHIHDSEVALFNFLPGPLSSVAAPWDGHDTVEKYRRCQAPWDSAHVYGDGCTTGHCGACGTWHCMSHVVPGGNLADCPLSAAPRSSRVPATKETP